MQALPLTNSCPQQVIVFTFPEDMKVFWELTGRRASRQWEAETFLWSERTPSTGSSRRQEGRMGGGWDSVKCKHCCGESVAVESPPALTEAGSNCIRRQRTCLSSGSVGWSTIPCTTGLWVQSRVGARMGGNRSVFRSLSLSLSPPFSLSKINKHVLRRGFKKQREGSTTLHCAVTPDFALISGWGR